MLTEYGKFLKKLRVDNGELLKDMAQKLDVTVAYLSAVENGKREVPTKWLDIIKDEYDLDAEQYDNMEEAAYQSKKTLSLDLSQKDAVDRNLALSFAREFHDLTVEEKAGIMSILRRKK